MNKLTTGVGAFALLVLAWAAAVGLIMLLAPVATSGAWQPGFRNVNAALLLLTLLVSALRTPGSRR